jgi:hypothetical protein
MSDVNARIGAIIIRPYVVPEYLLLLLFLPMPCRQITIKVPPLLASLVTRRLA